jgi:hypothetical protein
MIAPRIYLCADMDRFEAPDADMRAGVASRVFEFVDALPTVQRITLLESIGVAGFSYDGTPKAKRRILRDAIYRIATLAAAEDLIRPVYDALVPMGEIIGWEPA